MEVRRGVSYGFLLLSMLLSTTCGAKHRSINMVFYMHDLRGEPNRTAVWVTGPMGNFSQPFGFGTSVVIDDKLTSGPSPMSSMMGRAQGFYTFVNSRAGSFDNLMSFTAVMNSPPQYNGSTLCFMGSNRGSLAQREIAVVGGTRAFRYAHGFAMIKTIEAIVPNAILKFNVTLRL